MIYVECYADEALIMALGFPKRQMIHCHGKGRVCKRLQGDSASVGLIDEDPGSPQPRYLRGLRLSKSEHDFRIYTDVSTGNVLFMLCPRLEEWVLAAAKEAGVNPADYGLPDEGNELHRVVNRRLKKFRELLQDSRSQSPRLKKLAEEIKTALGE